MGARSQTRNRMDDDSSAGKAVPVKYVIRSKYDQRSLLAKPAKVGDKVRWVDPSELVEPWVFETMSGAERACDMCTDCGEVVPL